MDALPVEILTEILDYLPLPSRKSARLTSRGFDSIVQKSDFRVLASFIDPEIALATIEAAAADLTRRPKTIWSPHCSVPKDLPVPDSFLLAMYIGLSGARWNGGKQAPCDITVKEMARRLGRRDVTEGLLRQAMFRYVLYLSYTDETGEPPQMGPVNSKLTS